MTDTARKIGRPKKAPAEKRDERLPGLRLTTAERLHVEQHAAARGMSVMEFCRRAVLDEPLPVVRSQTDRDTLAELNRIGVNLNQLTHAANTGRTLENLIASALRDVVGAVERLAGRGP